LLRSEREEFAILPVIANLPPSYSTFSLAHPAAGVYIQLCDVFPDFRASRERPSGAPANYGTPIGMKSNKKTIYV